MRELSLIRKGKWGLRGFLFAILIMFIITSVAVKAWDILKYEEEITIDTGQPVEISVTSNDHGEILVPDGSFYSNIEGYTSAHVNSFTILFENETNESYDLAIFLTNIKIGPHNYGDKDIHGVLDFIVKTDGQEYDATEVIILEGVLSNEPFPLDLVVKFNETINNTDGIGQIANRKIVFDINFEVRLGGE